VPPQHARNVFLDWLSLPFQPMAQRHRQNVAAHLIRSVIGRRVAQ
jgi:hypothetical protein